MIVLFTISVLVSEGQAKEGEKDVFTEVFTDMDSVRFTETSFERESLGDAEELQGVGGPLPSKADLFEHFLIVGAATEVT